MSNSFNDNYRFLSNFVPAKVTMDGFEYQSVEHAYVAAKTLNKALRLEIAACPTAGQAKKLGKTISLREDWEQVRLGIMEDLLKQKFSIPEYKEKLIATGTQELVEGNTWHDLEWGVCNCSEHQGNGKNNLGKLLMKIRSELQQLKFDFEGNT